MKKHVWIPAAGVVLLAVAMMGRPSMEAPSPRVHPRSERQRPKERRQETRPEESTVGEPEKRMEARGLEAMTPASRESTVSPPSWLEQDSLRMRAWILGMTNEELARVVGTPQLGDWVSVGLKDLSGEEPAPEMGEFLSKLNLRILAVQTR